MHKIFISYKRQDNQIVCPIVEEIRKRTGLKCWLDIEGIESGDQFQNVIINAIDNAEIVIFMLSKNFISPYRDEKTGEIDLKKQTFPEREVMYALRHNKRLVPLSIDGTLVFDCKWMEFLILFLEQQKSNFNYEQGGIMLLVLLLHIYDGSESATVSWSARYL